MQCGWGHLGILVGASAFYFSIIFAFHYFVFFHKKQEELGVFLIHMPPLLAGIAFIWCRYGKSILISEILMQGMFGFLFAMPYWAGGSSVVANLNGLCFFIENLLNRRLRTQVAHCLVWVGFSPLVTEVCKYLVFRWSAYRSVVVDAQALLAYGALGGLVFGLGQNVDFCNEANIPISPVPSTEGGKEKEIFTEAQFAERGAVYLRCALFLVGHMCWASISSSRLAQARFLGRNWGMWSCIWAQFIVARHMERPDSRGRQILPSSAAREQRI